MDPQLAHKVSDDSHAIRLCTNDDWHVEPKVDGERRLITVEGEYLRSYNRRGERATTLLPPKIADWFDPFDGDWAFDGELLSDGRFVAFDLVHANDMITEATPFFQRRAALEAVHAKAFGGSDSILLIPIARTSEEKVALCRKIAEERGEGMMFKHVDGVYLPGKRTRKMLKWKYVKTVDCIVGEKYREGKLSCSVSLLDRETHELVDVGSVAMTQARLDEIERGDVMEVRYLYVNDIDTKPRLYQTAFVRMRTDKDASSCWLDQLEGTNKLAFEGVQDERQ